MRREVIYFDNPGPENTGDCIKVVEAALSSGYNHLVVATTSGAAGLVFAEAFRNRGLNLVVVTHSAGFNGPNENELPEQKKRGILAAGARIYTGTILTHSLETGLAKSFGGSYPTLIISQTLRRLGQGIKVCCEIVMEGCDAGLLPEGEPVVAVGGTGTGADTVCIIKGAASKRFLDLQVMEILAKPTSW